VYNGSLVVDFIYFSL